MKNTLVDLNVYLAKKQQGLINSLVEENPILASVPVRESSHGLYNVYSKATEITGMQEVRFDEELPVVNISFELGRTALGKIGGRLPMPQDAAEQMGGYSAYAEARIPSIISEAGNKQETRMYYKGMLAAAIKNGKAISAGGSTANKQYSLVAITWNMDSTVGLYDRNAVQRGKVFEQQILNGGNLANIEIDGMKCLGKEIATYMKFGLQLADPRLVGAIVNIEPHANVSNPDKVDGLPTPDMMDELLGNVRAGATTVIYCHPALQKKLATKFQMQQRVISNGTNSVRYNLYDYQGIPVISSYNIAWGNEAVIALS